MSQMASTDEVLASCFVERVVVVACCGNVPYLSLSDLHRAALKISALSGRNFAARRPRHLRAELIFHSNNVTSCAVASAKVLLVIITQKQSSDVLISWSQLL